jgi:hypothetical protein
MDEPSYYIHKPLAFEKKNISSRLAAVSVRDGRYVRPKGGPREIVG